MKKEEDIIREAYGKAYEQLKNNIDCDGWCLNRQFAPNTDFLDLIDLENIERFVKSDIQGNLIFRPKSLQGIEDNNGWMPYIGNSIGYLDLVYTDAGNIYPYAVYVSYDSICCVQKITHYQPIQKPKPPIY